MMIFATKKDLPVVLEDKATEVLLFSFSEADEI